MPSTSNRQSTRFVIVCMNRLYGETRRNILCWVSGPACWQRQGALRSGGARPGGLFALHGRWKQLFTNNAPRLGAEPAPGAPAGHWCCWTEVYERARRRCEPAPESMDARQTAMCIDHSAAGPLTTGPTNLAFPIRRWERQRTAKPTWARRGGFPNCSIPSTTTESFKRFSGMQVQQSCP